MSAKEASALKQGVVATVKGQATDQILAAAREDVVGLVRAALSSASVVTALPLRRIAVSGVLITLLPMASLEGDAVLKTLALSARYAQLFSVRAMPASRKPQALAIAKIRHVAESVILAKKTAPAREIAVTARHVIQPLWIALAVESV